MGDFLYSGSTLFAAADLADKEGGSHHIGIVGLGVFLAIVLLTMFICMGIAKKGLGQRVFKNRMTQWFEQLYLFIENMVVGVIGAHGRKYIPMIMTFWMVIFVGNLVALLFGFSPTADLSFNLGMALVSIAYVQWEGMRSNGVIGHFSHFAGPKLGIALIPISIMIFFIEIISELMKNVSLSLRLYGNIHGGHQAVEAMNKLGEGFYIPFGEFLLPIKILTVVVQSLIFTLLTCVYISLVTHHEEHGEHDGDHSTVPSQDEAVLAHAH